MATLCADQTLGNMSMYNNYYYVHVYTYTFVWIYICAYHIGCISL